MCFQSPSIFKKISVPILVNIGAVSRLLSKFYRNKTVYIRCVMMQYLFLLIEYCTVCHFFICCCCRLLQNEKILDYFFPSLLFTRLQLFDCVSVTFLIYFFCYAYHVWAVLYSGCYVTLLHRFTDMHIVLVYILNSDFVIDGVVLGFHSNCNSSRFRCIFYSVSLH